MNQRAVPKSAAPSRRESEPSLSRIGELEKRVALNLDQAGRNSIKCWLETLSSGDPDLTTVCAWCGEIANFVSKRARILATRFGGIRYQRAYYVCPHCHQKTCPLDEWLDPCASLRRMRTRLAAGVNLPVDRMARTWKLGDRREVPLSHWLERD
jgi:hypothetical protein